ncbi:MAG: DNA primase [Candidatus Heimdallarchaeota archaeon]|nr:DNA primase [Candidatus Heimdallarchaeota archaeon]
MGTKTDTSTTKYEITANFEVDGVVEKPDIVGAIYGQTDGLLSENLDIRELQKTGRIGRISVNYSSSRGKTTGKIVIPSSLSRTETAILAATLETVDRVGPCSCQIQLKEIVDVRVNKRQSIVDRASEIIRQWDQNVSPFSSSLALEVEKSSKVGPVVNLGDEGISAGPGFEKQKKTILVEGRADVVNLLKFGIDNTIAVNGTSVPPKLIDLIKKKTVTAFLDGDRGGDLILKELLQVANVQYVARAPKGKEVEDLNKDQVNKSLNDAVSIEKTVFLTGEDEGKTVKEFLEKDKLDDKKKRKALKIKKEPTKKITSIFSSKKELEKTTVSKPSSVIKEPVAKPGAPVKQPERVRQPRDSAVTRKPTTDSKRPPSRPSSDRPSSGRPSSDRPSSGRPSSGRPSSGRPSSGRPSSGRPSSGRPSSGRPSSGRPRGRPPQREIRKVQLPEYLSTSVTNIKTKLEAVVFDETEKEILRSSASEIHSTLDGVENAQVLVIDGVITQRLLEKSYNKGIRMVIGARKGEITKKPTNLRVIEFTQL